MAAPRRRSTRSWAITWPRCGPTTPRWCRSGSPARCAGSSPPRTRASRRCRMPTLGETGVSKYEPEIFYGIVAPAKTPTDVLNRLSGLFSSALKAPDMKPKLAQQGLFPVGMCGTEFGAYLRRQVDEYSRVIREENITVK